MSHILILTFFIAALYNQQPNYLFLYFVIIQILLKKNRETARLIFKGKILTRPTTIRTLRAQIKSIF